eukprot:scpid112618/ scgid34041/ 
MKTHQVYRLHDAGTSIMHCCKSTCRQSDIFLKVHYCSMKSSHSVTQVCAGRCAALTRPANTGRRDGARRKRERRAWISLRSTVRGQHSFCVFLVDMPFTVAYTSDKTG